MQFVQHSQKFIFFNKFHNINSKLYCAFSFHLQGKYGVPIKKKSSFQSLFLVYVAFVLTLLEMRTIYTELVVFAIKTAVKCMCIKII